MASARDILTILIDVDAKGAIRQLDAVGASTTRNIGKAQSSTDKWAATFTRAGVALTTTAAAGAVGLYKLAQSASNLEQAVGATDSVFGNSQKTISDFADTSAQSFGLSARAAHQYGAVLGAQLKGFGLSAEQAATQTVRLEQLSADLAATFGGPVSEAVSAVTALLRGERDPIEKYGVSLKQVDIDAEVAAQGLDTSTAAMKKQNEAVAALALLFRNTADIQGQFGRESETLAGQQARLRAEFENLQAGIGAGVLPTLSKLVGGIGDVATKFTSLPSGVQASVGTLATFATAATGAVGVASLLAGALLKAKSNFADFSAAMPRTASAAASVGRLGLVVGSIVGVGVALSELGPDLVATTEEVSDLTDALLLLGETGLSAELRDLLGGASFEDMADDLKHLYDEIEDQSRTEAAAEGFKNLIEGISPLRNELSGLEQEWDAVDKALAAAAGTDIDKARTAYENLTGPLQDLGITTEMLEAVFNDYGLAVAAADRAQSGAAQSAGELDANLDGIVSSAERVIGRMKKISDQRISPRLEALDAADQLETVRDAQDNLNDLRQEGADLAAKDTQGARRLADAHRGVADAVRREQEAREELAEFESAKSANLRALEREQILRRRVGTAEEARQKEIDLLRFDESAGEKREDLQEDVADAERGVADAGRSVADTQADIAAANQTRAEAQIANARDIEQAERDVERAVIDTIIRFGELGKVGGPWRDTIKEVRDTLTDPELIRVLDLMLKVTGATGGTTGLTGSISDWMAAHPEWKPGQPLPKMASGGTIPGPYGKPVLMIGHGGEQVIPNGQQAGGAGGVNITQQNTFVGGDVPTVTQLDAQNRKLGIRVALSGRRG